MKGQNCFTLFLSSLMNSFSQENINANLTFVVNAILNLSFVCVCGEDFTE